MLAKNWAGFREIWSLSDSLARKIFWDRFFLGIASFGTPGFVVLRITLRNALKAVLGGGCSGRVSIVGRPFREFTLGQKFVWTVPNFF